MSPPPPHFTFHPPGASTSRQGEDDFPCIWPHGEATASWTWGPCLASPACVSSEAPRWGGAWGVVQPRKSPPAQGNVRVSRPTSVTWAPALWSSSTWLPPTFQSGLLSGVISRVAGAKEHLCHSRGLRTPPPGLPGQLGSAHGLSLPVHRAQMGTEKEWHCRDTLLDPQTRARPPLCPVLGNLRVHPSSALERTFWKASSASPRHPTWSQA